MNLARASECIAPLALALLALLLAARHRARAAAAEAPPITVPFDHLTTGLRARRRASRSALREPATSMRSSKERREIAAPATSTARPSTRRRRRQTTSPARIIARPATTPSRSGPTCTSTTREVMGSCVSCHNGTIAQGEGPTHPATSQDCAACHTVMSWNPPKTVDHTQIPLAVAGLLHHLPQRRAGRRERRRTTSPRISSAATAT